MSDILETKSSTKRSETAEHKRLENLLDNQQQVLKLIAKGADLLKTLDLIARMVEKFSDNKIFASILLLDQKSKKNLNHGAAPSLPKTYIRAINGMKIGPNAGSCGTAAYTKKQVIVSDITTDPLWKDFKQLALKHKLRACWSTPILASNGKVLGTFALYYRQPRKPSPEDKKLIRIMTQTTALAIERKRADEERQELLSREKVAHAEAENERRRINNLFMQAPALIAVLRGREGTCELLNPSFSAMWGNRKVVGKKMREAWPELEGQGWFEMVEKINDTGETISNNEKSAIADWHNDGRLTEKFFNFVYTPYRTPEGKVAGVMIFGNEVTEQVLAHRKVEESEARFRAVFNQAAVAISITGLNGKWITLNKAYPKMLGYTETELKKLDYTTLTHPDDRAADKDAVAKLIAGKISTYIREKRYIHKNGSIVWALIHVALIKNEKGEPQYMTAAIKDITRRKQAEESLQISELRYRTMIEQSPLSVQILSPDGRTLQVNKAWKELWGASLEQMKDYNMLKDTQLTELGIMPYIKKGFKGEPTVIPAVRYEPNKTIENVSEIHYRWVRAFIYPVNDNKGTIREVVLVHDDITEQKQAEEALQQSEERLRFMAESMPQKIFTATPDGKVNYYNPQWMEYTGLSFEQMKDWGWTQFVHPDDVKENVKQWQHSVETGEPFQLEHRFRDRHGKYHWHLSRALPMRNKHGNVTLWIGSNTDIHDIRTALERERKLKEKTASLAEQRSQLMVLNRAKDEFISLASHQLRTPATGVKQYLGMVLEGYVGELTPGQQEMLKLAEESNERQIQIINDLLQVAHIDAGQVKLHKKPIDLVNLLEDVLSEHSSKFHKRRQKVIFKHKPGKLIAVVDEPRMRMILDNLLDNASKYSHDNKTITVELSKSKDAAKIAIQDEGVGMKKKDISKLFRKFSRLDNPLSVMAGGTGLGLYWVKKIVDLHGGSITVDSKLNKGSTFTVTVPA